MADLPAPRISVLMSTYNDADHISSSIDSVLGQTLNDLEFIIVDDGSTDGTGQLLDEYKARDSRVKIISQENRGLTRSLNTAMKESCGEFIARIDADDVWHCNKLEKQIDFLDRNDDYSLVGSAYEEIDVNGNVSGSQRVPLIESDKDLRSYIIRFNPFFHSSVIFKRNIIEKAGYYDEKFIYSQDYEYWVRVLKYFKAKNLSEILAYRRCREDMISLKQEKKQRFFAVRAKIRAIKTLSLPVSFYRYILIDILVIVLPVKFANVLRGLRK